MPQAHTFADNVRAIVELEERMDRERNLADRIVDSAGSVAGSVVFVLMHLVWFAVWAAINTGTLNLARPFDPYPFELLAVLVALEGVLLSAFLLIRQNRMSHRADRRAHLDLQINLLTEKEVSKALQMLERISERLELPTDQEASELGKMTAVSDLAHELDKTLPGRA